MDSPEKGWFTGEDEEGLALFAQRLESLADFSRLRLDAGEGPA